MPYQPTQCNRHPRDCQCDGCLDEWAEWTEPYIEGERLAVRDPERAGHAQPATDAERQAFLDREFPRAKEGVTP